MPFLLPLFFLIFSLSCGAEQSSLKEKTSIVFKHFVVAIHGIDLTIEDKEFFTLVGPSGCGKSTILNIIAGLEEPSSGKVFFDDVSMDGLSPKERDVAFVFQFQSYALYPHMNVYENMASLI